MTRLPLLLLSFSLVPSGFLVAAQNGAGGNPAPRVGEVPDDAGKAVNGLTLKLKRVPEQWYVVGDQFSLPLAFENERATPLSVLLEYYVPSVEVVAIDEQGCRVEAAPPMNLRKNPGPRWHVVNAGSELPHELHVDRAVLFSRPGRYKVWCIYRLDQETTGVREPPAAPFHGTVVSNVVEITLISRDEYVRRAEQPEVSGFAGMSMTLQALQAEFSVRENVQFTATLRNGDSGNVTVPPASANVKLWRVENRDSFVDAGSFLRQQDAPAISLDRNQTCEVPVSTNREQVRMGLTGPLTYRADLWLRHPLDAAEAAGRSLPPRRVISPAHQVSVVIRNGDVERLLSDCAESWQQGNTQRQRNRPLDTLCCYLDQIRPELARRNGGSDQQASLARDLVLAAEMKQAMESHEQPPFMGDVGVVVQEDSRYRLAPAWLGELNGIGEPLASAEEFAQRFVRLLRCSAYMYGNRPGPNSIPSELVVDHKAAMGSVGAVCNAIRQEAERQNVYIYQMELRLPPDTPSGGSIALTGQESHYSVSMLLGVSPASGDGVRYSIVAYENPDPRPNFFRSWQPPELAEALGRLAESDLRFDSLEELKSHFNSRQKRHEQIWIVPDRGAPAGDVVDAIQVIRNWHSVPLFVADLPPEAARFAK